MRASWLTLLSPSGIYAPQSLDRVNGTAPDIILDQGRVIWLHVDGVGASELMRASGRHAEWVLTTSPVTYLMSSGAVGTISLTCTFDASQHWFDFRLDRDHSIADHASNSTGRATIAFNDDPNKYVSWRLGGMGCVEVCVLNRCAPCRQTSASTSSVRRLASTCRFTAAARVGLASLPLELGLPSLRQYRLLLLLWLDLAEQVVSIQAEAVG